MTSRRPYWCPKTMKRRPCWCPKPILWELKSFLMQTLSFVLMNLHSCWPREWKHSIRNNFVCTIWNRWIWNRESWALESRIQIKESEIAITIESWVQVPITGIWNPSFKDTYVIYRLSSPIRIGRNCARGLEYGLGRYSDREHSFSQYGPTQAGE